MLSACAQSGADVPESLELYGHTVELDSALADRVPAEWQGGITVPLQVLQPNAFVDDTGTPVGVQPDLVHAMGTVLGIPVTFEVAPFDAQIPGVQSGKYAFTTGTGDFEERREVLTMVDYTIAGLGWMTRVDSPIETLDDICGMRIGVAKGTAQETLVEDFVAECEANGVTGTEVSSFANTLMTVPLEADRIDATWDSISSVLHFTADDPDSFRQVGDPTFNAAIAFGVVAGNDEQATLLRDVVQQLIDDGTYDAIFSEWGLEDLTLDAAYINSDGLTLPSGS